MVLSHHCLIFLQSAAGPTLPNPTLPYSDMLELLCVTTFLGEDS